MEAFPSLGTSFPRHLGAAPVPYSSRQRSLPSAPRCFRTSLPLPSLTAQGSVPLLGHLWSTSRARSLRYLRLARRDSHSWRSWLFLSHPPMVVPHFHLCSQCTAPRALSLRSSADSLASRLVAAPHSAIFGRRRARARSVAFGSTSCLTVAAFVVVSLAPANGGATFARVLSTHVASRVLAPALSRLALVASRRGSPLSHLRSVSCARFLRCPRLGRRVSQSRRSWSFLLHPPMAVLPSRVCSQCTAPRAPSPRPSPVSLASRLVAAPHSAITS